jgi:hypothetical protein
MATTKPTSDALSVKERVSAEEWQVRVDLAAAYHLVHHFGKSPGAGAWLFDQPIWIDV